MASLLSPGSSFAPALEKAHLIRLPDGPCPVERRRSMPADWGYVKRSSLWHYEALVKKLRVLPAYPVLWQAYNHNMEQAAEFARRLLRDGVLSAGRDLPALLETMGRLRDIGVRDWGDLLSRVSTRQGFLDFVTQNRLGFKEVI